MFGRLLPLFFAGVLSVFATVSVDEVWSQPAQGVSTAKELAHSEDPAKVDWLSKNAVPIRSIDPNDDDFADLLPLKGPLGGARIVMLGEASHGDAATFCAKQRLIRFLHDVMGFDVLAWEARFFAMEEMNRALKSGQPLWIDSAWVEEGVMKPIYQYTRATLKTDRPLRHTGVDIVFGAPRERWIDRYRKRLLEFLDAEGLDLASTPDVRMISDFLLTVQKGPYDPSEEERVKVQAAIDRVRDNLLDRATSVQNSREIEYFVKTLEDLSACEEHLVLCNNYELPPKNILFRDRKMGENLIWLAEEWYPDQKIIAWAANRHVARNISGIEMLIPGRPSMQFPSGYEEMGDLMHREVGDAVYSIAFVAYQGNRGRVQEEPRRVESISGSIQSLWHHTGHRYGFLDLRSLPRNHWLRKPSLAHVDGGATQRANWTNIFDGIFYVDTMFPRTESGEVPEGVRTKGR